MDLYRSDVDDGRDGVKLDCSPLIPELPTFEQEEGQDDRGGIQSIDRFADLFAGLLFSKRCLVVLIRI